MAKKAPQPRLITHATYLIETLLHRMTLGRETNFSTPIFLHAQNILPKKNMTLNPAKGLELPVAGMLPLELAAKVNALTVKALELEDLVSTYNKQRLDIVDELLKLLDDPFEAKKPYTLMTIEEEKHLELMQAQDKRCKS